MIRTTFHAALIAALAALGLVAAPQAAAQQAAADAPRVDGTEAADAASVTLNEVNAASHPDMVLFVTVLRDGNPVAGLGAEDFRVREDEVDQAPLTISPKLPPLSVALVIDTSGSMARAMDATRAAAMDFLSNLRPEDAAQITGFAREVTTLTDMSPVDEEMTAAIGSLVARGDTALYDALVQAIGQVGMRDGRKAVVLLSDGVDDDGAGQPLSQATPQNVLDAAAAVNSPIFAIGLGHDLDEAVLRRFSAETGGVYLNAPTADDLAAVYNSVAARLSGQYAIRYRSSLPADGTARRIDLDALGQSTSKSYVVGAQQADAPKPAIAPEGCAMLDAMDQQADPLQKAHERHRKNLIGSVERNREREAATNAILDTIPQTINAECARAALDRLHSFVDENNWLDYVSRNRLRGPIAAAYLARCENGAIAPLRDCLTTITSLSDDGLIDSLTRNEMRKTLVSQLTDRLIAEQTTDEALKVVTELYDAGLLNSLIRNDMRTEILAAE